MKCFADERDVCHNKILCEERGKCFYEKELNEFSKPRIPEFIQLLDQSREIHLKKNADYASEDNPFSNFERSAIIASWFNDTVDKSFAVLIGTKLARLAELRDGNKEPKNESIFDTFLDLGTYCFLWGSYVVRKGNKK